LCFAFKAKLHIRLLYHLKINMKFLLCVYINRLLEFKLMTIIKIFPKQCTNFTVEIFYLLALFNLGYLIVYWLIRVTSKF